MHNKKLTSLVLVTSVLLLILGVATNISHDKSAFLADGKSINCTSSFQSFPPKDGDRLFGTVNFIFRKNNEGEVNISGTFFTHMKNNESQAIKFNILRSYTFDYDAEDDGYITTSNFRLNKNVRDTLPDEVFNDSVFDLTKQDKKLRIQQIKNGYLIGNLFSPFVLCVSR